MFRDESIYPDANTFNPSRFLKDGQIDPDVRDPEQFLFGWGRRYYFFPFTKSSYGPQMTREFSRICPGRHFAMRVMFLTIAHTLATFDISKRMDEDGNPIVPDGKFTLGGFW